MHSKKLLLGDEHGGVVTEHHLTRSPRTGALERLPLVKASAARTSCPMRPKAARSCGGSNDEATRRTGSAVLRHICGVGQHLIPQDCRRSQYFDAQEETALVEI